MYRVCWEGMQFQDAVFVLKKKKFDGALTIHRNNAGLMLAHYLQHYPSSGQRGV